ncbi:MAG: HD domain-containing protein [Syntrophobacteraceae bacterium]|jgi:hypothetical protein
MRDEIVRLQMEARRIAARSRRPEFYRRFQAPLALARKLFFTHPLVARLRRKVEPLLHESLGHGFYHCKHVSLDCAALVCIEMEDDPAAQEHVERFMVLAEMAGLLHDISRSEKNHAEVGAREAERILEAFPVSAEEALAICQSIRNHEAFTDPVACSTEWGQMLSDCLYDADKFRWGPDNFTHTLWCMASQKGISLDELIERFPKGVSFVLRIQETFRTPLGRQYGPEIIETGIAIGKELYRHLIQVHEVGEEQSAKRYDNGH